MAKNLVIINVERVSAEGEVETLIFTEGVNLITGEPNAGKTTWMKQIDFVLGKDANINDVFSDNNLALKYIRLSINCSIDNEVFIKIIFAINPLTFLTSLAII